MARGGRYDRRHGRKGVALTVPQMFNIAKTIQLVPQECGLERIQEQIVDVPVSQTLDVVMTIQPVPLECSKERIEEQSVDGSSATDGENRGGQSVCVPKTKPSGKDCSILTTTGHELGATRRSGVAQDKEGEALRQNRTRHQRWRG